MAGPDIAEATSTLTPEQTGRVEAEVLTRAGRWTAGELTAALRRSVIAVDPAAAGERAARVRGRRGVRYLALDDGMGQLAAMLPADQARAAYNTIDDFAHAARTPVDVRGIDAVRADTLLDLIRAGAQALTGHCSCDHHAGPVGAGRGAIKGASARSGGKDHRVPARFGRGYVQPTELQIMVPITSLVNLDDAPGELIGHGPIPADMVRGLLRDARWRRILTDPVTGTVLDYGDTLYHPPAALRRHVEFRDRRCRFPGCRMPAIRCDLDHTIRFPDGTTSHCNLGTLCRRHHRLKHNSPWQLRQPDPGTFHWTSPTGRRYEITPPEHCVVPEPPWYFHEDPPDHLDVNPPDDPGPPPEVGAPDERRPFHDYPFPDDAVIQDDAWPNDNAPSDDPGLRDHLALADDPRPPDDGAVPEEPIE